jgi:histone deacetylase 1/2
MVFINPFFPLDRVFLKIIYIMLFVEQTGVALGIELDDKMPQHEYYEYFGPDYTLHVAPSNMENKNSRQLLEEIRAKLLDNLSKLQHAPSVQFQDRPPDTELPEVRFYISYYH